jgi:hypothetical protein
MAAKKLCNPFPNQNCQNVLEKTGEVNEKKGVMTLE